jgi:hypothetical protein
LLHTIVVCRGRQLRRKLSAVDHHLDLLSVQNLSIQQAPGNPLQSFAVR